MRHVPQRQRRTRSGGILFRDAKPAMAGGGKWRIATGCGRSAQAKPAPARQPSHERSGRRGTRATVENALGLARPVRMGSPAMTARTSIGRRAWMEGVSLRADLEFLSGGQVDHPGSARGRIPSCRQLLVDLRERAYRSPENFLSSDMDLELATSPTVEKMSASHEQTRIPAHHP